jgi:hypothetical protein
MKSKRAIGSCITFKLRSPNSHQGSGDGRKYTPLPARGGFQVEFLCRLPRLEALSTNGNNFWLCVCWMKPLTCANLNLMRLDSVRNGVSDAHANVCRWPCGHCRGKFCSRSRSSIWPIGWLRWKIVFDRSRIPVASLAATVGFPFPSLAPIFVLTPTSIRFWCAADRADWPLLRRVGLYGSKLPICYGSI